VEVRPRIRIAIHAAGARRGAGAGFNRVLTMAKEFPELCPWDDFLFAVRPELTVDVRAAAPGAAIASPLRGLPASLRVLWEQIVLPFELGRWEPDVVFGALNLLPLWVAGKRPAYVLMVTNLLPFSDERRTLSGRARLTQEVVRWLTLMSIRRADTVLLLSPRARDLIGSRALRDKARVLPPAVPKARSGPGPARAAGEHTFVVAADLWPHKSIETVVRALALAAIPGARVKIFGRSSNEGYVRALRAEIRRLGVEESVSLEGWVERAALLAEMAAAEACIAPARFENLSHVLAEAFAAGAPLLAADIPGSQEICGDAALFFPPGDELALAKLMCRIVGERDLRKELIGNGSERYRAMAAHDQSAVILDAIAESVNGPGRRG